MRSPARWERFFDHPGRMAAAIGLLVFLVFLPAVGCDFVNWDDDQYVYANPLVLGGLTWAGVRRAWTEVVFHNWAPLTIVSYQLDASVFGTAAWGFHLTNVVVHAVSTGLLYLALVRMTGWAGRSVAATALWSLHPLRVESVAWVAERKDVLSVLFLMLALVAYDWYCRRPGVGRYLAVLWSMLGSLLCKSTLVTLPVLLVLLDVWPLGRLALPWIGRPERGAGEASPYPPRSLKQLALEKLPLLLLTAVFVAITLVAQRDVIVSEASRPFWTSRLPNAAHAIAWYAAKTVWPSSLHPVHVHPTDGLPAWVVLASVAASAAIVLTAARAGRKQPYLPWGAAWFLTGLLPVLGLVQAGFQSHAERFTYVPHVGLFVSAVWAAADLGSKSGLPQRTMASAVVVILVGLTACTELQIRHWRSADILWAHVLSLESENRRAWAQYGDLMFERGRTAEAQRYYQRSIACGESIPSMLIKLARIFFDAGDFDAAREYRDWAVRKAPKSRYIREVAASMPGLDEAHARKPAARRLVRPDVTAKLAAGMAAARASDFQGALAAFREAIELDPGCGSAHTNAGLSCLELGRKAQAEEHLRAAVALEPDNPDCHVNLAQLLIGLSRWGEALVELETALRLRPADAEVGALLDLVRRRAGVGP